MAVAKILSGERDTYDPGVIVDGTNQPFSVSALTTNVCTSDTTSVCTSSDTITTGPGPSSVQYNNCTVNMYMQQQHHHHHHQ